jgi:hypothetical protein
MPCLPQKAGVLLGRAASINSFPPQTSDRKECGWQADKRAHCKADEERKLINVVEEETGDKRADDAARQQNS